MYIRLNFVVYKSLKTILTNYKAAHFLTARFYWLGYGNILLTFIL